MNSPLLRMLWWDSVAPLGKPVVPLVYWMLIGSSKASPASRAASGSPPAPPSPRPAPAGLTPPRLRPRRRVAPGPAIPLPGPGGHQRVPLRGAQVDDLLQGVQVAADLLDH